MSENLITNSFIDHIDKVSIRKYLYLLKMMILLSVINSLVESFLWYPVLQNELPAEASFAQLFAYRIMPIIVFIFFVMSVLCWYYYYRGCKLFLLASETNDAAFFNQGFKYYYISGLITAASFIISISEGVIRILFIKQ